MSLNGFSWRIACRRPVSRLACLVAVLSCATPLRAQDNHFTVEPLFIAGGTGSSPGDFGIPESVILDSRGQIAVTDKGRMMVHVYSRHTGEALFSVGGLGSGVGKFDRPNGIAVDSQGRILVVEQRNRRIQIFDADYNPIGQFGFLGSADGGFQKPMGITVDSQDHIYVTDESRADVQVFDRAGTFLWKFANSSPRLRQVESIEVDEISQRILVCDESRSAVNLYDMQGHYLSSFGTRGSGIGQFGNDPNAVRVDSKQRIWINDQGNTRINVYARDTSFLASFYNAANGMESADGIELSELHNLLLVADQGHDRVLAFDLMAMQAQLETIEHPTAASSAYALTAHSGEEYDGMRHPLWEQTKLYLEAFATGNPTRPDAVVVRVASALDARGILVYLTETGDNTGIFRGYVQLAGSSEPTRAQLAATTGNQVRAHLASGVWEIEQEVTSLPEPEVHSMNAGPGSLLALHRQPSLNWTFHDPAGIRLQDAFEINLLHEDETLLWASGEREGAAESFLFGEDLLPPAITRLVELRVRSNILWRSPQRLAIRRNTPPLAARNDPADDTVLKTWPPLLRAWPSPVSVDADGHPLRLRFETRDPSGKIWTSKYVDVVENEWLECSGIFNVMENETLNWRITTHDGLEATIGPWQRVHRNEFEEEPSMPTLLGPQENAYGHEDELVFSWSAATDPDPRQVPVVYFEWRVPKSRWHRETAESPAGHRWLGTAEDGSIHWRVRAQDPTGHEVLTVPRSLSLQRHWRAELYTSARHETSMPLTIGSRPGAQDAYVLGEDMLAPSSPGQPQVLSLAPQSTAGKPANDGDRIIDFRRPRSPGTDKQDNFFDILLRGGSEEIVALRVAKLELPASWSLRWQENDTLDWIELHDQTAVQIRLDHRGECRGRIFIAISSDSKNDNRICNEKEDPVGNLADNDAELTRHTATGFDLQQHLSLLANPLPPGIRLLPAGLVAPVEIQVFDARGRRVGRWRGRGSALQASEVFGRGGLPSGVYLLHVQTPTHSAQRKVLWRR